MNGVKSEHRFAFSHWGFRAVVISDVCVTLHCIMHKMKTICEK